jgi:hypothetical protein
MPRSVAYERLSHYPSLYLRESGRYKVDGCHMPNTLKRIRLEQLPPLELVQPLSKKQKLNYLSRYHPPTAFWDNLSKIWLTRRALEEFYRRNTQPARCSRSDRRVTRYAVAKWKHKEENWGPTQPTADFLTCFSAGHSEEVKLLT